MPVPSPPNPLNLSVTNAIANGFSVSSLISDVVGVFTPDFRQVFSTARPIKAQITETNKVMQHPVETGATITDHVVTEPVAIELSLIFSTFFYKAAYEEIKQLSIKRTLLTVQTRVAAYTNMIISGMPHQEDAEMYDTITMGLKLQEVLFATPQFGVVPRNASNTGTQARGGVQTTEATPRQSSAALDAYRQFNSGKSAT